MSRQYIDKNNSIARTLSAINHVLHGATVVTTSKVEN